MVTTDTRLFGASRQQPKLAYMLVGDGGAWLIGRRQKLSGTSGRGDITQKPDRSHAHTRIHVHVGWLGCQACCAAHSCCSAVAGARGSQQLIDDGLQRRCAAAAAACCAVKHRAALLSRPAQGGVQRHAAQERHLRRAAADWLLPNAHSAAVAVGTGMCRSAQLPRCPSGGCVACRCPTVGPRQPDGSAKCLSAPACLLPCVPRRRRWHGRLTSPPPHPPHRCWRRRLSLRRRRPSRRLLLQRLPPGPPLSHLRRRGHRSGRRTGGRAGRSCFPPRQAPGCRSARRQALGMLMSRGSAGRLCSPPRQAPGCRSAARAGSDVRRLRGHRLYLDCKWLQMAAPAPPVTQNCGKNSRLPWRSRAARTDCKSSAPSCRS